MNGNPTPTKNQNPQNGQQRPPAQGQRPMQNSQQRPPMQGQRPMQNGQQRPPMQGQRPMQNNQQRPPMQGQRPMQNSQQRPPMQGQRPMQNSQQRPPMQGQRPMQNGQRRPQPQGRSPQESRIDTTALLKLVLIISAVLVVLAIVVTCVVLAVTGVFENVWDNIFDDNKGSSQLGDDDDDGGTKKPSSTKEPTDKTVVASTLNLPMATPSGSYLGANASNVVTMSGVNSAAAVLMDMSTNSVTAVKNADTRVYPASMTKVMTLLVACERAQNAGKLLTVTEEMVSFAQESGGSGVMAFKAGEQVSVEDALFLINYNSDTIACLLIAEYISGSEAEFVKLMNQKAQELGLTNTNFTNTTGLHDVNHYTTCREMAAIMNCAMQNPVAKRILSAYNGRTITIYANYQSSRTGTIYAGWYSVRFSDNPKVGGTDMTVTAGKTGFEDIPTSCFVTVAKDASTGKQYICVVVGRTDTSQPEINNATSTGDTEYIYKNYANE